MPRIQRQYFETLRRLLHEPESIGGLIFGVLILNIMGNAAFTGLTHGIFGERAWLMFGASMVILAVCVYLLSRRNALRIERGLRQISPPYPPRKHRGLIFLVSQEELCRGAVAYHKGVLERCWLIASEDTLPLADKLRREFQGDGIMVPDPIVLADIYNPKEYRDRILEIFRQLPENWSPSDVIGDYVGMTKSASVGMALAWAESGFSLQYTRPVFANGKPIGVGDLMAITLNRPGVDPGPSA